MRKGYNVFTEEGIAMLAMVLHTSVVAEIIVKIMDDFVKMRRFVIDNIS